MRQWHEGRQPLNRAGRALLRGYESEVDDLGQEGVTVNVVPVARGTTGRRESALHRQPSGRRASNITRSRGLAL